MQRRLIKQGQRALTMTLPAQWVDRRGLKPGDSVDIEQHSDRLVVRSQAQTAQHTIEIDVTGNTREVVLQQLIASYITGADRMIIAHDNPSVIQQGVSGLIGMTLISHGDTSSEIATILKVPEDTTEQLLRRAGHMLDRQADLLLEVTKGSVTVEELRSQELLLDYTLRYCLRFLHKYAQEDADYKHFLLLDTFERAADQIRAIAQYIDGDLELATLIHKNVRNYTKRLFSKETKRLHQELRTFRNNIPEELFVHGLAYSLAELMYDNLLYVGS